MSNIKHKIIGILFFAIIILNVKEVFAENGTTNKINNLIQTPEDISKLGQKLDKPDFGWRRYDDNDSKIEYIGGWATQFNTELFNGTFFYSTTPKDKAQFNFTGTKLRVIGSIDPLRPKFFVEVDGVIYEGTERGPSIIYGTVVTEIFNLENKEHSVKIYFDESKKNDVFILDAIDIDENGELKPYNEKLKKEETVAINSEKLKYKSGMEFKTQIELHNGLNICAEDLKLSYDRNRFEYVGIEEVNGIKVLREIHDEKNGELRLIVVSLGKINAVNGDKILVNLKFKGKINGKGKIDINRARIADNETVEKDILDENCGEVEIEIEGVKDVNRSGEFTLLDLAIDGWYYDEKVENTDLKQFDADVVINGIIDSVDLEEIVKQMINNSNYASNI